MRHEFDSDYEQEDERMRGRSRRRDGGHSPSALSDYSQRQQARQETAGTQRETAFRRGADGKHRADKGKRRALITFIIAEIFALLIVAGCWFVKRGFSMMQTDSDFKKEDMTNPYISLEKEQTMKGYWTVALFGVDSRDNSVGKGNNADVIILCNINQETYEIKLVSIFRDSYLNVDDKNSYNKINQAYFTGGPKQAIAALNRNLDLEIDDYATFNWKAVADAINILGGVDVELSKAEFYYINSYITETVKATKVASVHLKKAGMNHLDGVQAVAYARLRKMDTDFARTERQRKIIELCFDKMKKANFSVVNNVMEVVFPQVLTSVTMNDVIPAAMNVSKYTIAETMGFPSARSDEKLGKKGDCVIPQTLESNVISLHQFLFDDMDYVPSDMVKKISAKISSDTGLYKEGKAIDSVGTNGGYIPKSTAADEGEGSSSDKSSESSDSSSQASESIIDGEYDIETDEDGHPIDPPEDYDYGTGTVRPSSSASESSSAAHPGSPTVPSGTLSPGGTSAPESTTAATPGGTTPGGTTPGGTSPGTSGGPGGIAPTTAAPHPGSTTAAPAPTTAGSPNPGSNNITGSNQDGPGSVIVGPGSNN